MEKLYKMGEAAELLNISENTIRYWVARKQFPAIHIGAAVRIRESDVLNIIENGHTVVSKKETDVATHT